MRMCKNFGRHLRTATALGLLCCSSAGCGTRVLYVTGGHKTVPLEKGQPAPDKGVWVSPEYMSEIYEQLGEQIRTK